MVMTSKTLSSDFPYESDITQSVSNQRVMGPVIIRTGVHKMYDNREARFYAS